MTITKALIVAEPWIDLLLSGDKIWEMRSKATAHRGWFGLIRKGSGKVVGVACLVDVGEQLSQPQMLATIREHQIPEDMIRSGQVAGWSVPWKLADVRPLPKPVAYQHKSGAVTWVNLDDNVAAAIDAQRDESPLPVDNIFDSTVKLDVQQRGRKLYIDVEWDDGLPPAAEAQSQRPTATTQSQPMVSQENHSTQKTLCRLVGEVQLTEGNIRNGHIYLRPFFDRFPSDAVGGSNKASTAQRLLKIDTSLGDSFESDLDGSKKFFRARGPIRTFLDGTRAKSGNIVVVDQLAPYHYRLSLKP